MYFYIGQIVWFSVTEGEEEGEEILAQVSTISKEKNTSYFLETAEGKCYKRKHNEMKKTRASVADSFWKLRRKTNTSLVSRNISPLYF